MEYSPTGPYVSALSSHFLIEVKLQMELESTRIKIWVLQQVQEAYAQLKLLSKA